ncbi:hypothetical protein ACXR0O_10535 [Verrucomicrobiota bacterium sgz303538]
MNQLREAGAIVRRFRFPRRDVVQPLAVAWPFWRALFQSSASQRRKEAFAHMAFHLFYRRHLLYLEYLREYGKKYQRVFLSDCRDVFFQADPFAWNREAGMHFFLEDERISIGQCPHHVRWISSLFGEDVLKELSGKLRACAGTTLGTTEHVIRYLETMVETTMSVRSLKAYDGDQGVHNFLLHKGILSSIQVHENLSGPVMTLGSLRMSEVQMDDAGYVVNRLGTVVPILHQYDRIPELREHLLSRLPLSGVYA